MCLKSLHSCRLVSTCSFLFFTEFNFSTWTAISHIYILTLQASLPVATYYCTENKLAERFASLKHPGQIQKETTANQNSLLSQLILKKTSLKRQQVTRLNHKTVTRHKRNHMTTSHDQMKTRVGLPKNYLMVLRAFKISQSPNNYANNNQLEHLKNMGISKSHDDLGV